MRALKPDSTTIDCSRRQAYSGSLAVQARLLHAQLPASVRMACSVVPPSHRIACPSFTGPPIQQGLQDRITEKKFSVWEGGLVHLQPMLGRNLQVPGERQEVSPLLDCGVRMYSG